ncbi:hypothetical protein LOTGIDRAFT_109203, partial [Lottia gigantea]
VFLLKCGVQEYAWGKVGSDSEVAKLAQAGNKDFQLKDNAPYAELWMGTHPNCPSFIDGTETTLEQWIKDNPDKLGSEVKKDFGGKLPFLFKVLSVQKSLSIQAHPHKVLAEHLHKTRPDIYKDPNHKPEMAIALTPFQGLCGFRVLKEIAEYVQEIEELRNVIGCQTACKFITASMATDMLLQREALKDAFKGLMEQDKEIIQTQLHKLVSRVKLLKENGEDISAYNGDLLLKLDNEFPGDVGGFAIYFLNIITLQPGEAMFLEADMPHAYLSGDCMECMACSDNVVRAGLTPKFIDVHTLCEMLDYTCKPISKTRFQGIEQNNDIKVTQFNPPVPDFSVTRFEIPDNVKTTKIAPINSASISIVIQGEGHITNPTLATPISIQRGSVLFTGAMEDLELQVKSDVLLFRASAGL